MFLQVGDEKDDCECDLFDKLMIFQNIVEEYATPIQVLCILKKCNGSFPNLNIAFRIMLAILITSDGTDRSFSKLKLIKTYLRSSMS